MRFMRGRRSHHKMSTERFTHSHMPIMSTIPQKPWHAYFSAVSLKLQAHIQPVFYATNWIIDLPSSLFLDLNDIPGNFSNCHDLICTSSCACQDVDGGSGGTTTFQKRDTLRSTFIQAPWNSCCSLVSFFPPLYLPFLLSEILSTNLSSSRST